MKNLKHSERLLTRREIQQLDAEYARRSFYGFCQILSPDFYCDDRPHLKILCDTLQAFYTGELGSKNLGIQLPPRHGKSRTLTNFSAWILGKDNQNKIITASFNDDLAQDFSRHTRDIIIEEKTLPDQLTYSDVFKDTMVKKGDSSYKKWALEGQFFNYKGTGIGGSVTGRGGNYILIDDPVKDAETAYNPAALEKIWLWYTGTILSRQEEGAKKIICMTPWMKGDLLSKVMEIEPGEWFILNMPAYKDGEMLCKPLLSYDSYKKLDNVMDEAIFKANYLMERIDIKGRLYSGFETYEEIPEDTTKSFFYTDTADEGKDYLCSIAVKQKGLYCYVTDVIYTQEAQEITEPMQVDFIIENELYNGMIESNNGGRAFARNIKRMLKEKGYREAIKWFHQSKNKKARILTHASNVQKYILFPKDWAKRWPVFYNSLMTYQKEGKNKHDDAPDTLTGIIEKLNNGTNQNQLTRHI